MIKHRPFECTRDRTMPARYHTKSWSALFKCMGCGRTRWFNLNYLGQGVPHCNGAAIRVIRTLRDLTTFRDQTKTAA